VSEGEPHGERAADRAGPEHGDGAVHDFTGSAIRFTTFQSE